MKVAFICVNYNNSKYTLDYISSLNKSSIHEFEIIVVDNNSSEIDLVNLLKSKLNFKLIKSKTNLGYFKGLNLGLDSIGNKDEYDYVVIGNNDLTFENNFINELSNEKLDSSIFVIAPNIIKPDGSHQNPHIVNKFNFIERLYRRLYYTNYYISVFMQFFMSLKIRLSKSYDRDGSNREQLILMGYGACYILTHDFFKNFKNLDAPNFLMGEEGVLANQILSKNGKTIYKPNIIVHHHDHTSIGKITNRKLYNFSKESYEYAFKNHKFLSK